ncbi:MAG: aminotransferase class I/II-fold pyridoxal phosphate-dependent enzyme [Planctomycetes bacterium]|jgi:aspartate aminotransferase|nr:aminotransferase class I/II-fold pyridoxal phosphate-dependent enzyme [Planctomycetota bacterium]MCP4839193.1 aminotransferase class I/II-fold pyridoxal phosphate-dependent enzyme [Planctomycetota bacterium]
MSTCTLSRRGSEAPASPIRALAGLARAAEARGITVHALNIGQPDISTPSEMTEAYRNYHDDVLAYAPSDGFVDFRQDLAVWYSDRGGIHRDIEAEDIVVTTGGSEALLFSIASVTDPGDEVLVCEPYYTNYAGFSHLLGVEVSPVTLSASDGFQVHPAAIAAAITGKTRALILPTPGNPTGTVLSRDVLEAIAKICVERDIFFICDEVYRDFVYDVEPGTRAASLLDIPAADEHAIIIDSVSKRYSACGARIGWVITRNTELREAALRFAQTRLSPASVDQYAAHAALSVPESWFRQVNAEYQNRRDILVDGLRGIGLEVPTPQGAFYLAIPLPVDDADAFCRWLVSDFDLDGETVCLAPLAGFYRTDGLGLNEVRMAYCVKEDVLRRSVKILEAGLMAWKAR